MTFEPPPGVRYRDAHGNIWRSVIRTAYGTRWELVDTSGDRRPSHELWHPGRSETKRAEVTPTEPLERLDGHR